MSDQMGKLLLQIVNGLTVDTNQLVLNQNMEATSNIH